MNKVGKTVVKMAAVTSAATAAGIAIAAYNSRAMKTRRMIRRAGRTMDNVGQVLTAMAQITGK